MLPSLLVHEIHVNVTSRPAVTSEVISLSLSSNTGPASNDINFSVVTPAPVPGVTVWKGMNVLLLLCLTIALWALTIPIGKVKVAEETTIQPQQVAVCFNNIPSTLSFNANSTFPQTFTYITAIRTSLDTSDIVSSACRDWKNGTELAKRQPPNDLFHTHVFEWANVCISNHPSLLSLIYPRPDLDMASRY